ncbi:unnamed protein product [Bursaphelenchus okinawaensis]|uniref:Uncharacterized protein n=1 Tax=Bursaphelenchus okinawaensis TaxID=465554 RepID=A0A811JW44_9BILA|nr:unnamed protein product [Bursaphelenchus okinawaensis]CAG9085095.1 unnamed protein product [Bursaphelenchus okinawaensis]
MAEEPKPDGTSKKSVKKSKRSVRKSMRSKRKKVAKKDEEPGTPDTTGSTPESNDGETGTTATSISQMKTVMEDLRPDKAGEYTDELSDLTDDENADGNRITHGRGLMGRIQPMMYNKRIRHFVITNITLIILNIFLMFTFFAGVVYAIYLHGNVVHRSQFNKPCVYEWGEWSKCSASCRPQGQDYPVKTRRINPNKIVRARGIFADIAPCPLNLDNKVDFAPCNTHYCPLPLSSYKFQKRCNRRNVNQPDAGCYRIRDIPLSDSLILIDTPELVKEENCTCQNSTVMERSLTRI